MSEGPKAPLERARSGAARRAAIAGSLLTGALLLAIAAVLGQFDVWLLGAAVLASGLSGLVFGERGSPSAAAMRSPDEPPRPGISDALLADMPDPVILVDGRRIVVEANEAARALLPALKAGRPLSFALRSPDVLGAVDDVLKRGEARRIEYAERIPTERTFEVQISLLRTAPPPPGVQSGVFLFFRDVTSARRLEHMRADFVANASHELRTPLASLLGFIQTLQGPARDDAGARERFLEIMRGQAERMARLVDDLLSLSRIEMREHVRPETPVDLVPVVEHVVDTLAALARERHVEIRLRSPARGIWVLGDRDELLRLVENLVENALKYGDSGERVEIDLAQIDSQGPQGQVELSVRDFGPGIDPQHLPRLTERFFRADVAESRQKGGTGLGLAIVKHIVNRHRGRLEIESRPGEGALFRVTLPAAEPRKAGAPA